MSQQAVRQAARRSALDAQAVLRRERANRERRLERLAVAVPIALGEREGRGSERGTPRRCGAADDDRRRRTVVARGAPFRGRRNHPDRMRIPSRET
jgi:hypothetical protein